MEVKVGLMLVYGYHVMGGWVDGWMGRVLVETIAPRAMHL